MEQTIALHERFPDQAKVSFGWGTLLSNEFRGLSQNDALAPFSLVCKAISANNRPTVKLSDNPHKISGPKADVARYQRVFSWQSQDKQALVV